MMRQDPLKRNANMVLVTYTLTCKVYECDRLLTSFRLVDEKRRQFAMRFLQLVASRTNGSALSGLGTKSKIIEENCISFLRF
jgi:hypothetical protein